jgi:tetratricopeptide (TPR) repeat protein
LTRERGTSKVERTWLVVVAACYLLALLVAPSDPAWDLPQFDEVSYLELADGRDGPSREQAIVGSLGYAALLGLVRALSPEFGAVVATNLLLLYGAVVASYLVARRFADVAPSLLAASLLASAGPPLVYALHALPDTLSLAAVAGCMWAWLRATERRTRAAFVVAWLLLMIAVLARPVALLAVPWCLWLHARARGRLEAVVMLALLGSAHLPFYWRNARAGDATLLASSGPVNFWIGNGRGADGAWRSLPGQPPAERVEDLALHAWRSSGAPTPAAARRYWLARSWHEIREQPGAYAKLLLRKLLQSVQARELVDNRDPGLEWSQHPLLARWQLPLWPLLGAGLLGLALAGREAWRAVGPWLAVALATCVGFLALGRYRLALLPPLVVGAAFLLTTLQAAVRRRRYAKLAGLALALGVVLAIVLRAPMTPPSAAAWHARAVALHRAGRLAPALRAYEQAQLLAATRSPGERLAITTSYGRALLDEGRLQPARNVYAAARELLMNAGRCAQLAELDRFLHRRALHFDDARPCRSAADD